MSISHPLKSDGNGHHLQERFAHHIMITLLNDSIIWLYVMIFWYYFIIALENMECQSPTL